MKTYTELTPEQQAKAQDKVLAEVVSRALQFNDEANGDGLQAAIDQAFDKAENDDPLIIEGVA